MFPANRRTRALAAAVLSAAVLSVAVAACGAGTDAYRPLQAGDPAPAFAAIGPGGDTVSLASLRGEPVLLNVWATWCPPCREEMPLLQALHERYGARGLHVIGVSVDSQGSEEAIASFVEQGGITFPILHDPGDDVSRAFKASGVPETYLIGADGTILHRWIGPFDPLAPAAIERFDAALDAARAGASP